MTVRLTAAQALVRFLEAQQTERDGVRRRAIPAMFGIFGHGNVAGVGQALQQHADLLAYHPARNEQAMVHLAAGYARQRNRLGTFAHFGVLAEKYEAPVRDHDAGGPAGS